MSCVEKSSEAELRVLGKNATIIHSNCHRVCVSPSFSDLGHHSIDKKLKPRELKQLVMSGCQSEVFCRGKAAIHLCK